jgi:hypothetical protein
MGPVGAGVEVPLEPLPEMAVSRVVVLLVTRPEISAGPLGVPSPVAVLALAVPVPLEMGLGVDLDPT